MDRALYSNARAEALQQVYKNKDLNRERSEDVEADFEEVAASCGHFSFSLLAFASEIQNFLTILEELKEQSEKDNGRSWNWLKFWRKSKTSKYGSNLDPETELLIEANNGPAQLPKVPKDDPALGRRDARKWKELRGDSNNGLYRRTLKVLRTFSRDDSKFAPSNSDRMSSYLQFVSHSKLVLAHLYTHCFLLFRPQDPSIATGEESGDC